MRRYYLVYLIVAFLFSCEGQNSDDFLFTRLDPNQTQIHFVNKVEDSDSLGILYYLYFYNGGGVSVGDINNDGLPDVFLTSNLGSNKLFLNKGALRFEDISLNAGIGGKSDWNTGVTMADVNGDGLLDIYVCAVVGIHGLEGENELYINNGDLTFSEKAEAYKLNFKSYSTSAAFFDYDKDGDLDLYLLNHSVHTENSYGPAAIRANRDENSGDKLLKNEGGVFEDVSEAAGIFGGANGYGLGLATADFNNDGWTDIYVSNDFHEDDYYYVNQGDGTFVEQLKEKFSQTSRFSMGNDVADINHDGFVDIITLDMLAEDEKVLKSSMSDDPIYTHDLKIERLKYHPQYARNMLQVNHSGEFFQEYALFSGVESTDWSWSPLFADFDLDGNQDLFITTGIPRRPNDHDYIAYISNENTEREFNNTSRLDQKALEKMPTGNVKNFIFKGGAELVFSDQTGIWVDDEPSISNGAAWADFDLDGDLDLITNNINEAASLYQNNSNDSSNYLSLHVEFDAPNNFGIGTKIVSWHRGIMQTKQLFPSRGFQSSSEPMIHFGYGKETKVDSLLIIWPDDTYEMKYDISTNQRIVLRPKEIRKSINYENVYTKPSPWFEKVEIDGIDYVHQENRYIDFNRQKLIPYKISDRGPAVSIKDINHDGLEDLIFGGAKNQTASLYLQSVDGFKEMHVQAIENDSLQEDVSLIIEDFNGDGVNDLYFVSGGGEYLAKQEQLRDRLYLQVNGRFEKSKLPDFFQNGSVVKSADFDKDGDLDLFVGSLAVANDFGKIPKSFLLKNENGIFEIYENELLGQVGMVTDAIWTDFNLDGWEDLIVVGEWMSPAFFKNENGNFVLVDEDIFSGPLNGLWQCIIPFDMNGDGQIDYLLGNWGLNTKFTASSEFPLKMYYSDFDQNGNSETILAYEKNGEYFTLAGLAELGSQLSYLKKRFTSHSKFAGKNLNEIFNDKELEVATQLEVHTLSSGYLLNKGGSFTFQPFQKELQVAPIMAFLEYDFNGDGEVEVLVGGNYFGVNPYHGKLASMSGSILTTSGKVDEGAHLGLNFTQKSVRAFNIIQVNDQDYLLVTYNNDKPEFFSFNQKK